MKLAGKFLITAAAALLFVSCKDTSKDGTIETPENGTVTDTTQVKETAANLETTSFTIEGMTCPTGCAAAIEKKLAGLDGVQDAKVDYEKKTATVSFDTAKQTPEKLVETVEGIADGAYKVADVKSSGDKGYFDQEKEKKKKDKGPKGSKSEKGSKDSKGDKGACCAAEAKTADKKAGCCASDSKKSCHAEAKGGSL